MKTTENVLSTTKIERVAEYMIRFAAALHEEGRSERSKEVTQVALKNFRYTSFNKAVAVCAGEQREPLVDEAAEIDRLRSLVDPIAAAYAEMLKAPGDSGLPALLDACSDVHAEIE